MVRLVGSFLVLSVLMVAAVCVLAYCARAKPRRRRCTRGSALSQKQASARQLGRRPAAKRRVRRPPCRRSSRCSPSSSRSDSTPARSADGRVKLDQCSTAVVSQTADAQERMVLGPERRRCGIDGTQATRASRRPRRGTSSRRARAHGGRASPTRRRSRGADDHGRDTAVHGTAAGRRSASLPPTSTSSGSTGSSSHTGSAPPAPPIWSAPITTSSARAWRPARTPERVHSPAIDNGCGGRSGQALYAELQGRPGDRRLSLAARARRRTWWSR